MADGDEDGGGVRTECTETRRQGRAWCVVESTREPLLSNGEFTLSWEEFSTQGDSAPKGHWAMSGDICHCRDWEMLWVASVGCCSTPCRAQDGPQQGIMYPKSIVPRWINPG